jgi:hypothetical protein
MTPTSVEDYVDYPLPQDEMNKSLKSIEGLPKPKAMKKGKPV